MLLANSAPTSSMSTPLRLERSRTLIEERHELQRFGGAWIPDAVNSAALREDHGSLLHRQLAHVFGIEAEDVALDDGIAVGAGAVFHREGGVVVRAHVGD